jgi:hypothetical protein
VRAPPFFHLGFNDVAHAALERVAEVTLMLAKHRPAVVVEFFENLERPPPVEHVAADHVVQAPGSLAVPGVCVAWCTSPVRASDRPT